MLLCLRFKQVEAEMEIHTVTIQQQNGVAGFYKQNGGLFEGSIWYFSDESNAVHIAGSSVHQLFAQAYFQNLNCTTDLWTKISISKILLI